MTKNPRTGRLPESAIQVRARSRNDRNGHRFRVGLPNAQVNKPTRGTALRSKNEVRRLCAANMSGTAVIFNRLMAPLGAMRLFCVIMIPELILIYENIKRRRPWQRTIQAH